LVRIISADGLIEIEIYFLEPREGLNGCEVLQGGFRTNENAEEYVFLFCAAELLLYDACWVQQFEFWFQRLGVNTAIHHQLYGGIFDDNFGR